jgi:Cu/Ag efflux protein CusF
MESRHRRLDSLDEEARRQSLDGVNQDGRRVDCRAPKVDLVTIAHEPVKTMNWPAMPMGFMVKDKSLFDKLTLGKRLDFSFVQDSKGYVVTVAK